MLKRLLILVLTVGAVMVLFTGVALAATPQNIYDDFAKDGKLDGSYTQAELQAYLHDARIHQYGDPTIIRRLDDLINQDTRSTFPFTGFQMMIAGAAALVLIGGGVALRVFMRPQKS